MDLKKVAPSLALNDSIVRLFGIRQVEKQMLLPPLKIWHIPQVPMSPFEVPVASIEEAKKLLVVLADYDLFQYEHRVKPDYANASGLCVWDTQGQGWVDWEDEETGDGIWDVIRRERR